jgi:HD-GYP domain-containing protein (c-di-GMP phosphodiesterase class II)
MMSSSIRRDDAARRPDGPVRRAPTQRRVMQIDSYDSPDAQDLLRTSEQRLGRQRAQTRELITNGVGAVSFLAAAGLLAALAPWHGSLSVGRLLLVLGVWIVIERVRFPVASCWTYPTMLVLVPALFLLPTPIVPLVATAAIVLRAAPQLVRGKVSISMLPAFVTDAWFTLGPALVLVLAGGHAFGWSHWPVYVLAFIAQLVFDLGTNIGWSWIGEGTSPRLQVPLLGWIYLVDFALAPLGLLIAAAAVQRPGLLLIALSPTVVLVAFARERKERLDQTVSLSTAYRGTALLLGDVVEADDRYTGIHSRDVVDLAVAVARTLRLDGAGQRNVEFTALLHDIGKIRIPKEILNKSESLSDEEWEIVRRHTIDGEQMLRQVGGILASIGRLVRSSHERFDGLGYPDGLAGKEIPIESRIVTACDAFSAMTTDRPYRGARTREEALAELERCSGSHFDPQVVEALVRVNAAG